jgi:hypothetical protein
MKRKKKPKTATTLDRVSFAFYAAILASLTLCLVTTAAVHAQQTKSADYALIFGTVWAPDDRPIYGVTVKIRRVGEKKARWEVSSNHLGEFEQRVPPGKQDYVIWADLRGYRTRSTNTCSQAPRSPCILKVTSASILECI